MTNLSTGTQNWSLADLDHEYVFNSSTNLASVPQVWQNNSPSTLQLKPGYYYWNGTLTLSGHAIRGAVTFIASQIVINNDDTALNGSAYIGLQPYDENNLLLWATGNSPRLVEQITNVSVASLPMTIDLPADTSPPSPWANRRLCQLVLEKGIDALPESSSGCVSGPPFVPREETYRSLLKQFLDNPTG